MKATDDTIQFESRDEVSEILAALDGLPEKLQTDIVKTLASKLAHMELMW